MFSKSILLLLSNHRQPGNPIQPAPLSMTQILSLLQGSQAPHVKLEELSAQVQTTLNELETQGEIFKAAGNKYCIAPPTLLTTDRNQLNGLGFQGDRAYLPLAHECLETHQPVTEELLRPKSSHFDRIEQRLQAVRINLLTAKEVIQTLPPLQKPAQFALAGYQRVVEDEELQHWLQARELFQYCPQWGEQRDRWRPVQSEHFTSESLLRLRNDDYLWYEAKTFYDIDRDTAMITMFYLDRINHQPLSIVWSDRAMNKLNLQGVLLPSAYAQAIWRLSKAIEGQYRIRFVDPGNQPFVTAIFQRLGCNLR